MAILEYDFAVANVGVVPRAFRGIEARARIHSRRMDQILGPRQKGGTQPTTRAGRGGGSLRSVQAQEQGAIARERIRSQTKLRETEMRLDKRSADQRVKTVALAESKKAKLAQQTAAKEERTAKGAVAEQKRAEREKVNAVQRAEKERTRAAARSMRERERLERSDNARALRRFKQRTLEEERELKSSMRRRRMAQRRLDRIRGKQSARMRGRAGFVAGSAGGAIRGIGGSAAAIGGIAGTFAVAGSVQRQMGIEAQAAELANQAFREGKVTNRGQVQQDVIRQTKTLGAETGIGAPGLISALRKFVEPSGRLDVAQEMLPILAEFSDATGAAIEDVGKTGGQVVQAMVARNPNVKVEEIISETTAILSSMAGQAKVGAIEFKDLAQQMGRLISSTSGFEGKISDLAATMGAVAQISLAGGAASPEEAMTAIKNFRDDLITNEGRFRKAGGKVGGVNVFADEAMTRLRNPVEILVDTLAKTKGSLPAIAKLFGKRGRKAAEPFQQAYTEAGGGEAGERKLLQVLNVVRAARVSAAERKGSAGFRREQADRRLAKVTESFMNKVGEDMMPAIENLIPALERLVEPTSDLLRHFGDFVAWFAENPLRGLGALILGKVAMDLARAGIGKSFATIASGELTGKLKAMNIGFAAGTIVATGATMYIQGRFAKKEQEQKQSGRELNELRALAGGTPEEFADPEVRKKALAAAAKTAGVLKERAEESTGPGVSLLEATGFADPIQSKTARAFALEAEHLAKAVSELADRGKVWQKAGENFKIAAEEAREIYGGFPTGGGPNRGDDPPFVAGTPPRGG